MASTGHVTADHLSCMRRQEKEEEEALRPPQPLRGDRRARSVQLAHPPASPGKKDAWAGPGGAEESSGREAACRSSPWPGGGPGWLSSSSSLRSWPSQAGPLPAAGPGWTRSARRPSAPPAASALTCSPVLRPPGVMPKPPALPWQAGGLGSREAPAGP